MGTNVCLRRKGRREIRGGGRVSAVPTNSDVAACPHCGELYLFQERCHSYCTDTSTNEMAQEEYCPHCGRSMTVRFRHDLRVLGTEEADGEPSNTGISLDDYTRLIKCLFNEEVPNE